MTKVEILTGTLKGQTLRLISEYTALNGKNYVQVDRDGDGRVAKRMLAKNVRKVA